MRPQFSLHHRERGSILLAALASLIILSMVAVGALGYSINSLRNSVRQDYAERAKTLAENELEYLCYQWQSEVGNDANTTVNVRLAAKTVPVTVASASDLTTGLGALDPIATSGAPADSGVARFLLDGTTTATGTVRTAGGGGGATPPQTGVVDFYNANVRVTIPPHFLLMRVGGTAATAPIEAKLGRRFARQRISLFQYAIFYQNDMEFGTGTNVEIRGTIASNSSIYIGSQSGATLTLASNVKAYYASLYNGSADPMAGTVHRLFGIDTLVDPAYAVSRTDQVVRNTAPTSFIGDVKPDTLSTDNPAIYPSANDVYRSLIAPPYDATGTFFAPTAENAVVSARRMHNKARIVIKIGTGGILSVIDPNDPGTEKAGFFGTAITSAPTIITDRREDDAAVNMYTIDVAQLAAAITTAGLDTGYNGVVYAFDQQRLTTPGRTVFRLINGHTTPNFNNKGFTFATNDGLYVQGDFNTAVAGSRAVLMGDSVTALSQNWDPSPLVSGLATPPAASTSTADGDSATTIVAGIVSGNTETASATIPSGGVQNLVRLQENWGSQSIKFIGSLGQLYRAKYFTHHFMQPSWAQASGLYVYTAGPRTYTYDPNLALRPPGGSPNAKVVFDKGDYFTW